MAPASSLVARIADAYPRLSPQEARAADFLRDHQADLAVYNATEVARLSGVSKATISRLYRRLGFDGADDLRDHVRALRSAGTPLAADTQPSVSAHLDLEIANLRTALSLDLAPAAALIAGARRVVVVGFRNSYPVALHLRQQLAQARDDVLLAPLPGQSIGEELAGLDSDDVVVLVGFRRRPEAFARVLGAVVAGPARVVLLADASAARHGTSADVYIECPVDSVTAFDSYAAAASVVSRLSAAVLDAGLTTGRARISVIGAVFDDLDELETY